MKGNDVLLLQRKLVSAGFRQVGEPDGKFGSATESAVVAFQQENGLTIDGVVGEQTWNTLLKKSGEPAQEQNLETFMPRLLTFHGFRDSVKWCVGKNGLDIEGTGVERSSGKPKTVTKVWDRFNAPIEKWSKAFGVPVEVIVATICTESSGDPSDTRIEPGYISDEKTPHKVSPGLMQTLISTARSAMQKPEINREWLLEPANSIAAGTAYIAAQMKKTDLDPPKVACAYNAGGVYHNKGPTNRWKMRQFPIGKPDHADRFVKWFNDFCFVMAKENIQPGLSYGRFIPD